MRKCIRCHTEMIENLDIKKDVSIYSINVTKHGFLKGSLGQIQCAVCPECGYVETYLSDVSKIKNLDA
ncbi:MAG: nucleic acid-binding protein [Erysipelotrichaceae bacterium]|nr:nucleic acid-binding protein [Erysipelotrichaceae bacterium]